MVGRHAGHSKFNFVHLSGITDGNNQVLKYSENLCRAGSTIGISYRLGISMGVLSGLAIAFIVHSLDPTLH